MIGPFTRGCGVALCVAAVVTLGLNVFITPFLPQNDFAAVAASQPYLIRQLLAALCALLLVFGVVGIHVSRLGREGIFGMIAFIFALTGSVGLFQLEYGQASTIRALALEAPDVLMAILSTPFGPLQYGTMLVVLIFSLGWFLFALSLFLSSQYSRLSAALIMAGLVISPILGTLKILGPYAQIVNSLIIGGGWFLIGLQMIRLKATR